MSPFRVLTVALFAAATVPRLAHRGMFVDGITYAAIARNLAEGRGSFWTPSYTATLYPQFHEHPPFGFWLQSLWFRVLGDQLYVERAYTVAVGLVTAALIAAIWRTIQGPPQEFAGFGLRASGSGKIVPEGSTQRLEPAGWSQYEWLPVALWIVVPVVSWSIVGNLLETTVALFATAATLGALRGNRAETPAGAIAWGGLSGACIVAAVLTKGPVGSFPLVAPLAFSQLRGSRRVASTLVAQWVTIAGFAVALLAFDTSRSALTAYVSVQLIPALRGQRELSASSFQIAKELLQGVILPLAGVGVLAIAATRRFVWPSSSARRHAASFLLLGLAGTLPILASAKQAGHYLVPAVPLYALASATLIAPTIAAFVERSGRSGSKWANAVSLVVLLGTIAAAYAPGLGRDRTRLANLDVMEGSVPRGATVGICPSANGDWGLHAWFERRFGVSLDAAAGRDHDWFLKTAPAAGCPPALCAAVTDPTRDLVLMKCSRRD